MRAVVENRKAGRIGFFDVAGLYREVAAGVSVKADLTDAGAASLRTIFGEGIAISDAPPEPPAALQGVDEPEDAPADDSGALEAVNGIGPSYARTLRVAGVADILELAVLTDAEIDALTVSDTIRARIPGWRDEARKEVDDG